MPPDDPSSGSGTLIAIGVLAILVIIGFIFTVVDG